MIKEICLVRLSAIGDVVLALPLVKTLQKNFPQARLTWVIAPLAYRLIEGLPGVNFIVIDKPNSFSDYRRFRKRMRSYHFDVLLAMQASLRANLLYPCIKAKRKIGFDKARAKDLHTLFIHERIAPNESHLLDGFLQFAKAIGATEPVIEWSLPLGQDNIDWAKAFCPQKPFLAINPFASKIERQWPLSNYVALIHAIKAQYDVDCVITGSPEDKEACEHLAKETSSLSLAGQTSLKQIAAVLSLAQVLIAPDTGPVHIAQAVKTPVIGLYAVAPSSLSGPYLTRDLVIDKYALAVERFLHKNIEAIPYATRVHHVKAMSLISVDDVLEKLAQVNLPKLELVVEA